MIGHAATGRIGRCRAGGIAQEVGTPEKGKLADITATERVSFVMKEGKIIRNGPPTPKTAKTSEEELRMSAFAD